MGRLQRMDWFRANQPRIRTRRKISLKPVSGRRPRLELLEARCYLSVNPGFNATLEPQALRASEDDAGFLSGLESADFTTRDPWDDTDPGEGITLTYSYSNLLDGNLPGGLTDEQLIDATEEALGLWATYAPLHFVEVLDSGPAPSDDPYDAEDHPILRIGHHFIDGGGGGVLAHAYFPSDNGLGGDVHFDNSDTWALAPGGVGFDVIYVMVHELGHALGLGHEAIADAIMNPIYDARYSGPGSAFLYQDDIDGIRELYGEGEGSVTPLPPLMVNTTADGDDTSVMTVDDVEIIVDATPDELTLREAISFNSFEGGRRGISFHPSIYGSTILLDKDLGSLTIDANATINGLRSEITVSAADPELAPGEGFQVFIVTNNDPSSSESDTVLDVSISGLTLEGGFAGNKVPMSPDNLDGGGAIYSTEDLSLSDMKFVGNHSEERGGAIYSTRPVLLVNSGFINNTGKEDGGAVYSTSSIVVDRGTFESNTTEGLGGALFSSGSLSMTGVDFLSNTAEENGGAVYSGGSLNVTESTFTSNSSEANGGAVYAPSSASILESTFELNTAVENGGAVYSLSSLAVDYSSFAENEAGEDGGAIYSGNGLDLSNSTLNANHADSEGGGIAAFGFGTDVVVVSSTLSGNSADRDGGGIHIFDDNPRIFRVLFSTIYGNTAARFGGGINMLDGVLGLEHSIVAGNSDSGPAPDIDNDNFFSNPAVLARYSLVGDTSGSVITQQAPNLLNQDPLLGPLQDNGGLTLTHHPLTSSPVLNAGNPNVLFEPQFDQRGTGFNRVIEGVIDIGAVESGGFESTLFVNTLADTFDIIGGEDTTPDFTSLREAIYFANEELGATRINFDESLSGGTIELDPALGELSITDNLAIDASDLAFGLVVSASAADPTPSVKAGDGMRIFNSDDGSSATLIEFELVGLTLQGGDVSGNGGAIYSTESLVLFGVSILDNYSTGNGGGVYHRSGTQDSLFLIEESTLAHNEAAGNGGGVWTDTTISSDEDVPGARFLNTTVSGNTAGDQGGGIMNHDGMLELRHVTVTENSAFHGSGVVSFADANTRTQVYSSIISGNEVDFGGVGSSDDTGYDVRISRGLAYNSFQSLGYNLIGIGDAIMSFDNDDMVEIMDPGLFPLGTYGGRTMTHALRSDSPALEAGDPDLPRLAYTETVFDQSPLLYWTLDEETGFIAEDVAGDADGTMGNGVTIDVAGAASQTGRAVDFNGSSGSQIATANGSPVGTSVLADSFTISLWFNPDFVDREQVLVRFDDPNVADTIVMEMRWFDGQIVFQDGTNQLISDDDFNNTWHNVVLVQNGNQTRLFVDGNLDTTANDLNFNFSIDTKVSLGAEIAGDNPDNAVEGFVGMMDEFVIFDSALNPGEVRKFYRTASTEPKNILLNDQRGSDFDRVIDRDNDGIAVIDIGAFELAAPDPTGDFNSDGEVNGADFLAWQRGIGVADPERSDGDGNFDGKVDEDDLAVWMGDYGTILPANLSESEFFTSAVADKSYDSAIEPTSENLVDQSLDSSASTLMQWFSSREQAGQGRSGADARDVALGRQSMRTKFVEKLELTDHRWGELHTHRGSADFRSEHKDRSRTDSLDSIFEGIGIEEDIQELI